MDSVLLIVPPFASVEFQSLALHNLQALGRKNGYCVDILYLNMEFAKLLGEGYRTFCNLNYFLLGERVFAKAAWGDLVDEQIYPGLYNYRDICKRDFNPIVFFPKNSELTIEELKRCEDLAITWGKDLEKRFRSLNYKYIGVTSSFEQVNSGITVLKAVKRGTPGVVTFIGGFNCENRMAYGIDSLDPDREIIDYIFSGESDSSFISFLKNSGSDNRIIYSEPFPSLNEIPNLDYTDYFVQLKKYFPELLGSGNLSLAMESSRGCWWGEKSQCSFCGTSQRVRFREKSFSRIKNELEAAKKWGINRVHMADLIMPEKHLTELLPYLSNSRDKWRIYFEEKVSLNYNELKLLKSAGVMEIQPGIETLSNNILKKMAKGTSLKQNITFLKDATTVGFEIFWNIVWGIPGESISDYKKMNELLPLISHLEPPVGIFHMTLVRFSPYFNNPEKYGISNISPLKSYYKVYPNYVNIKDLALIFTCEYLNENVENPGEIEKLIQYIEVWNNSWKNFLTRPRLELSIKGDGTAVVLDTRELAELTIYNVSDDEILNLLEVKLFTGSKIQNKLINKKYAIKEGNDFIPLVLLGDDIRKNYGNSC